MKRLNTQEAVQFLNKVVEDLDDRRNKVAVREAAANAYFTDDDDCQERLTDIIEALINEGRIVDYDYWDCGPTAITCSVCYKSLIKNDLRHKTGVDKLPEDIKDAPLDWHDDDCAYVRARRWLDTEGE